MIISLAMLLAGTEWHADKKGTGKGWILIDKKDFRLIYSRFKSPIDSLLTKGFELHTADEKLEKINVSDSSAFLAAIESSVKMPFSYWSILVRADKLLPAGYPVYFFSNDKLADATGNLFSRRPIVSIDLRWQMTRTDTTFAAMPVFSRQLSTGAYQLAAFQPSARGSQIIKSVSLNPPAIPAITDTSTVYITIYHNKFSEDLRYLQAAIRAIASFGNYKLSLKTVNEINNIPKSPNWLFWLSNELPPSDLSGKNLFIYQPGTTVVTKSWLTTLDGGVPPGAINVYQRIAASGKNPTLIWKDGFGNPLLTLEAGKRNTDTSAAGAVNNALETQRVYRFYTRFHPAWSDLSWNPDFPKLIFPLIIQDPVSEKILPYEENRTEVADVIPTVLRQTYKENKSAFETIDLTKQLWLITFILFAIERILSITRRNMKQPGLIN